MALATGSDANVIDRWWSLDEIVQAIAAGHSFYTQGAGSGKIADVRPYRGPAGRQHLQSDPDGAWDNNLDALPLGAPHVSYPLGKWDVVTKHAEAFPVHAALLPNGLVLYFGGSQHDENARPPFDSTRLWNPATNSIVRPPPKPLAHDLFCCGHALMPDGRLLAAGGTAGYDKDAPGGHHAIHYTGTTQTAIFDWREPGQWQPGPNMAAGRWYPTCLTLSDGHVLTFSGHPSGGVEYHLETSIQRFDPATNAWDAPAWPFPELDAYEGIGLVDAGLPLPTPKALAAPKYYYPRLHSILEGPFDSTPMKRQDESKGQTRLFWLNRRYPHRITPHWLGERVKDEHVYEGPNFSSVLLPINSPYPPYRYERILICGGKRPRIFDLNERAKGWQDAGAPREYPKRAYVTAVLLPDGSVLAVGGAPSEYVPVLNEHGGRDDDAIKYAERYDPQTGAWQALAESCIPRVYHTVALLLPDGRVFVAGSNHDSRRGGPDSREMQIETFSPPYLFRGPRPVIDDAPATIGYDEELTIRTAQARQIRSVALIRAASVTHGYSSDQRYIGLEILRTTDAMLVVKTAPNASIAVPGYYLLFIVDAAGVPSIGRFIHVPVPLRPPDVRTCDQIREQLAEHQRTYDEMEAEYDSLDPTNLEDARRRRILYLQMSILRQLIRELNEAGRQKGCF